MPFVSQQPRPTSADYDGKALEARLARLSMVEASSLLNTLLVATPPMTAPPTTTGTAPTMPESGSSHRPVGLPTNLPAHLSKKQGWGEIAALLDGMLSLYEPTDSSSPGEGESDYRPGGVDVAVTGNEQRGGDDDIDVWNSEEQAQRARRGHPDDWLVSEQAAVATKPAMAASARYSVSSRTKDWLDSLPTQLEPSTDIHKQRRTETIASLNPAITRFVNSALGEQRQRLTLAPYTPQPHEDPDDIYSDEALVTAVWWAEMLEEMNRRRQQQETPGAQPSETPNQQQQGMEVPPSNVYSTHTERAAYINYTLRRSQGSVQGSGSGGGSSQVPRLPEYPRGSPGEDSTGISGSPSSDNPLSPQRGSVTTTGSGSTLVNPHYAPTMLPPPPNLPYAPSATSTNQQPTFHDLRCIRSRTPTPGIIDGTQPNQTSLLEPRTHDGRSYYHPQFQCWLPFPTEVPAEDEAVHPGTKQLVMEKMQRLKDRMLGRKKKVRKNKISAPVGPAPPPVLGGQMIRITPPQVRFQVEEGGREDGGA